MENKNENTQVNRGLKKRHLEMIALGGTIGTGSIMGGLLQVLWLVMDVCIYAPFVIASNKIKETDEEADTGES